MRLIKFVFFLILYTCVYLFFFGLTLLSFLHFENGNTIPQSSAFLAVLFPLIFPFVIWRFRRRFGQKVADAKGVLEKIEVCGPLLRFLSGYLFGYLGVYFLTGYWPDFKKEYPWTVWVGWQGASFLLGFFWANFYGSDGEIKVLPWNKKKESEREKNSAAIRRLSSIADGSDHPFDLMEARLPYPERLKPDDVSPLYKSMMRRSMELNEAPPEKAQNLFKDTLGIVCSPGEKFLFVFKNYSLSVLENKSDLSAQSVGVGLPGPFGATFGLGTSKFSPKEQQSVSRYGEGMTALTTKNLYFQQNGIWQKVERSRIVSCKNDYGEIGITFSDQSGQSKLVEINFFDYEIASMLETLLRKV